MKHLWISSAVLAGLFCTGAVFGAPYVYPAKGQSAEQQKKDEYECHQWAIGQTGYDPVKAASTTKTETKTVQTGGQSGGFGRGALGGAAKGALVAGIADGDAGKGAAVGGVFGGLRGHHKSKPKTEQVEVQTTGADPGKQKE